MLWTESWLRMSLSFSQWLAALYWFMVWIARFIICLPHVLHYTRFRIHGTCFRGKFPITEKFTHDFSVIWNFPLKNAFHVSGIGCISTIFMWGVPIGLHPMAWIVSPIMTHLANKHWLSKCLRRRHITHMLSSPLPTSTSSYRNNGEIFFYALERLCSCPIIKSFPIKYRGLLK